MVGLTQQEAPWAQPVEVPGVTLFDAFPICTEKAPFILEEAEADPALCAGDPADRASAHAAIVDQIAGFLTARSATQQ